MASAQPELSSVLQEELTCPVCLDLYIDPHLLPCGHNFCMVCLRRLKRQAERGRFRCPECRETHRCSVNLQKNFKLANITEDYQARRDQVPAAAGAVSRGALLSSLVPQPGCTPASVPCDYCPPTAMEASGGGPAEEGGSDASTSGENGKMLSTSGERGQTSTLAVKTCLKCEVSMCQEHLKPHLELVAFREHPLTEPLDDLRRRKCPDHDEMFRYYCIDDKVCVCNACTIEGGHTGHTIKTLKNTMKDLKGNVNKYIHKVEKKCSTVEKRLQEQKEKERRNKKFLEDSEQSLTKLGDEVKAKMDGFISSLRVCVREHCSTNGLAIHDNISRICQDKVRLLEARRDIERLLHENDSFRFIEVYKTSGKRCRKQLIKAMFYPEYIDMETDALGSTMEEKARDFLTGELHTHINDAIDSLCPIVDPEEEQEGDEEEATVEEDDDEDSVSGNSSEEEEQEEEMRSEGEEEEEEEVVEDGHDQSESADDVYSPEEEEEEEDEVDDEEEDDDDDDEAL